MSKKITTFGTAGAAPADTDYLVIVDISDTSQAASGTTKKIAGDYFARTDGNAAEVTGGGSIVLAGYTLTVPATGTVSMTGHTHVQAEITDLSVTTELGSLTDVNIDGTPADDEVLAYDTGTGQWTNQTAAEAGLAAASHPHVEADITDLGAYLTSVAVADISDTTIDTPADDEVLAYDLGTGRWTNQTAAEAGLAAASHPHVEADITDLGPYEPALGNPASDGYVLSSTAAGVRSWVEQSSGAPAMTTILIDASVDTSVTETTYATTQTTELFYFHSDMVPSGGTVHLAAFMQANSGDTTYAALVQNGTGSVASSEISTTATTPTYVESGAITMPANGDYFVDAKAATGNANCKVITAWLVIKA